MELLIFLGMIIVLLKLFNVRKCSFKVCTENHTHIELKILEGLRKGTNLSLFSVDSPIQNCWCWFN